jgi:hypothetical protein
MIPPRRFSGIGLKANTDIALPSQAWLPCGGLGEKLPQKTIFFACPPAQVPSFERNPEI